FGLERLGFPVIAVPTVVLPFHPGHGKATRIVAPPAGFAGLLADLGGMAGLPAIGGVLSGYLGAPEQAEAVPGRVQEIKRRNPAALYLLDPILGDDGGLYMSAKILAAIRDRLLPLAEIETPHRHALGFLTGAEATDNAGLTDLAKRLGPREVLVTTAFAPAGEVANLL